jgi:hypothetical protein
MHQSDHGVGTLMMGVLGYHYIAQLSWIDAVLNAS